MTDARTNILDLSLDGNDRRREWHFWHSEDDKPIEIETLVPEWQKALGSLSPQASPPDTEMLLHILNASTVGFGAICTLNRCPVERRNLMGAGRKWLGEPGRKINRDPLDREHAGQPVIVDRPKNIWNVVGYIAEELGPDDNTAEALENIGIPAPFYEGRHRPAHLSPENLRGDLVVKPAGSKRQR